LKKLLAGGAVILSAMTFATMNGSKNIPGNTRIAKCSFYDQDTVPEKKTVPDTSRRHKRDTPPAQKEQ
jgi:hypothetical protein